MRAILVCLLSMALTGCLVTPPIDSTTPQFPVKMNLRSLSSEQGIIVLDIRPDTERSFMESPTADGRFARLGDGAFEPGPLVLVSDAISTAYKGKALPVNITLKKFRTDVTFRQGFVGYIPNPGPTIPTVIAGAGGKLLLIPGNFATRYAPLYSKSSVEVAIQVEIDGTDFIVKMEVPFEGRLTPADISATVNQGLDRLVRELQ
jgi:hypothetical protein